MASIEKRVYDRSTYSATTISTFDVVASYLVDIYYNELYGQAVKWKNAGKVPSVTEGYKHTVAMFVSAMNGSSKKDKTKYYEDVLNGIKEYFTLYTSFSTLTISDCINKITHEFIPSDYFKELSKDQQRSILKNSLNNIIREFSKRVIKDFIKQIIDNHDESANIDLLKECIVDLLINEREHYYHRFLDSTGGKHAETVDKSFAIRMQQEIKKISTEKIQLINALTECKNQNNEHVKHIKQLIHKYKTLESKFNLLKSETDAKIRRLSQQSQPQPPPQPYKPLFQPQQPSQPPQQQPQPIQRPPQQPQPSQPSQPTLTPPQQRQRQKPTPQPTPTPTPPQPTQSTTYQSQKNKPIELELPTELDDQEPELRLDLDEDANSDNEYDSLSRAISSIKTDLGEAPSISDIY
jgi:outer membrane biosynthesis protein TonB